MTGKERTTTRALLLPPARAGLLVSVRSAHEARAALAGGATILDVKEPSNGPLGRAPEDTWKGIASIAPSEIPVSVALGELVEWADPDRSHPTPDFAGIAYRKLGLAGAGPRWRSDWAGLREQFGPGASWIAVAYADWRTIPGPGATPSPLDVLAEADVAGCAGILVDTWNKGPDVPRVDLSWRGFVERARGLGLIVAIAGGLDLRAIRALRPLGPDYFAVRGAACAGGTRSGTVDAARVSELAGAIRGEP